MCGRYYFNLEDILPEIERLLNNTSTAIDGYIFEGGEIFPGQKVPVYFWENGRVKVCQMKWGFPKWDKKGLIINARSESAYQKKIFSEPLKSGRCIIPISGFYEWDNHKNKHYFTYENSIMYLAGIYKLFTDKNGIYNAFTILTTSANESISKVHDRMPVILFEDEIHDYLEDEKFVKYVLNRGNVKLKDENLASQLEL